MYSHTKNNVSQVEPSGVGSHQSVGKASGDESGVINHQAGVLTAGRPVSPILGLREDVESPSGLRCGCATPTFESNLQITKVKTWSHPPAIRMNGESVG